MTTSRQEREPMEGRSSAQQLASPRIAGVTPPRLLDAVGHAVVVVDLQGTVLEWNAAAEGLFGHSTADALGGRAADLIRVAPGHPAREARAAVRAGNTWQGEY